MLPRSVPSGQLADMKGTGTTGGGGQSRAEQDGVNAGQQWQAPSTSRTERNPSVSPHAFDPPSTSQNVEAPSSTTSTTRTSSNSNIERARPLPLSLATATSAKLDARSSSYNPSTTSSASSSNTISLPMSSTPGARTSTGSSSMQASMGGLHATRSRDSTHDSNSLPSPRAHSETRHSSHSPSSSTLLASGSGSGHGGGGLLHPLRTSTRPSTKRASSYTPGLVVSPQGYGAHHTTPSSPLHSPLLPPSARPEHRSSSIDLTPATAQASSISLPMANEEVLQHKLEELVRKASISKQQAPAAHHLAGPYDHLNAPSTSTSSASASSSQTPAHYHASSTSSHRDGYEAERELDSETPSLPSSLTSQLESDVPTLSTRHQQQQQQYSHFKTGPPSRHTSISRPSAPGSPRQQAQNLKGKGRSRELSGSSNDHPQARDFATDEHTDLDPDTGTDLASDAGNTTWDVRETDKLRSAKDAYGRRMINQYARVAELGKGVHGKVWLCEDTETGEFYAIKSVNREDRRNKSLKRSQAEAQAKIRAQELEDEAELKEELERRRKIERENNPNASFDEEMQLNDPIEVDQPTEKELARKKSALVRKTMMDEKVKQEIAIMKRIHHPNVVQLREVIDDIRSKKIFMVLEYMPGGQVEWTLNDEPVMTVDETRRVFRDVVLGLEYLHFNGIIHRDIKPANLLWTQDKRTAKISDFGVSHVSEALARSSAANPVGGRVGLTDDRALRKTEGSPAFFAPELCSAFETTPVGTPINELGRTSSRPDYFRRMSTRSGERPGSSGSGGRLSPITRMTPGITDRPSSKQRNSTASIMTISQPLSSQQQQAHKVRQSDRPMVGKGIDVWALGVTLYCLLFGYTPFHEARSEFELYNMIPKKEITIPPTMGRDRLPTGSGVEKGGIENDPQYAEGREVVDLLSRLLEKDPTKRIELWQVKRHPWVLRNLENSQGWLQEHDLARRGVVEVTQEEVQQATAERTKPQAPASGLKAALKRFGETFGFGGNALRRSSSRRDRSKSVSSTSASMTTASGWDGRSDASRAASRQASIVKKKPSTVSNATESEAGAGAVEDEELSPDLLNHAAALKRKLATAKAAQTPHDGSTRSLDEDMPTRPSEHYRSSYANQQQQALSRSLSGESSEPADQQVKVEAKRRQSLGHLLQPPAPLQRRISSGGSDASGPYAAPSNVSSRGNISRPSLSSLSSRPSQADTDPEGIRGGGFRNLWHKFRSGSRTPAALPSPSRITPPVRQTTSSTIPSSETSSEPALPAGLNVRSPGSTRHPSAEYIIFSPATSGSRPSSQDTDADSHPAFQLQATATKDTVSTATIEGQSTFGMSRGVPEEAVSDSSESLSDFDDDVDELGGAISPEERQNAGEGSQPSSYGHHNGPVMWSNAAEGWKFNPEMPSDPLGRYLRQQQHQSPESLKEEISHSEIQPNNENTPKPNNTRNILAASLPNSPSGEDSEDEGARKPLFKTDFIPLSTPIESRRRPNYFFKDGSIPPPDYPVKSASPSPARLSVRSNPPAIDDDDDEEGEEVMIKPKSRLRRATNASASAPTSARPSMPASPRPSFYQSILPPP